MQNPRLLSRAAIAAAIAGSLLGAAAASAQQNIAIRSELVASGLVAPVGVYAPPGDTSRIFIVQQSGQIVLFNLTTNTVVGNYLNLGSTGLNLVGTGGLGSERGLLGLAFDPSFASNGFFYVNYTNTGGNTVVRRYTANAPFNSSITANTASGSTLITITQDFSNHNGGSIQFGPDGMLYVFMGDGGDRDDPNNRAQNDTQLLGKILRLDVNDTINGGDGDGSYVPNNNPFRAFGHPRDKVWAKGMRNPWRSTFDRVTGDLWVADVGQDVYEEINVQPAIQLTNPADGNSPILNAAAAGGLNYGWDCREGLQACPTGLGGTGQGCNPNAAGYFNPIIDYSHSFGCSITGGYVYRGSAIPALDGFYFYVDYCTSSTHRILRYDGTNVTFHADIADQLQISNNNLGNITSYGEDGAGEMYMCVAPSNGAPGSVYRIAPFDVPCGCPCVATGAQRAIFSDSFEANLGWSVANSAGLTVGAWVRAQPANALSWQWDPMSDADDTGWCFVTGNGSTNSDIDGGSTTVTSPALDFTQGDISICYSYQFATSGQTANDGLFVEVSSNGAAGPWTLVATHNADLSTRWIPHAISQAALTMAGIANTTNMRVRFRAIDADTNNNVEAALDSFKILTGNVPDCNENGVDDLVDIANGTSLDVNDNQIPDECEAPDCACDWDNSGAIAVPDIFAFLASWFANDPAADFDGQNGVGVPDIFAFLACWFAGCP